MTVVVLRLYTLLLCIYSRVLSLDQRLNDTCGLKIHWSFETLQMIQTEEAERVLQSLIELFVSVLFLHLIGCFRNQITLPLVAAIASHCSLHNGPIRKLHRLWSYRVTEGRGGDKALQDLSASSDLAATGGSSSFFLLSPLQKQPVLIRLISEMKVFIL